MELSESGLAENRATWGEGGGLFYKENLGKNLSWLYLYGKNKLQSRRNLVDRI